MRKVQLVGWLGSMFGSRKRREARRLAEERLRALLDEHGAEVVWPDVVAALRADPDADGLFRLAAHVLRMGHETRIGELFDRAADAPGDPQPLFALGSALLNNEQSEIAAVVLQRALTFVPFDAVVRSELALAQARSGQPHRVLATLALHPCLADDPGALFELAWASLLTGDLDTAEGALRELRGMRALRHKLELAIDRAKASPPARDARDFYFVEHGGLLIDATGPQGGRHAALVLDDEWVAQILADLGAVIERLTSPPRHVIAIDAEHFPLAEAVASACGGSVLPRGRGRMRPGILPLLEGRFVEERLEPPDRKIDDVLIFALTIDPSRSVSRAPDLVGAFARQVDREPDALKTARRAKPRRPSAELLEYVDARRVHLPPDGERVFAAYLPDAPLPL